MNNDNYKILLETVIDRIEVDDRTGKWKLDGVISENERNALLAALRTMGGELESGKERDRRHPVHVGLNVNALGIEVPADQETLLCLDYHSFI